MRLEGGAFNPETITILRAALDDAWTKLSSEQQAAMDKVTLAQRILRLAAQGERDPIRLRNGAVGGVIAPEEYASHRAGQMGRCMPISKHLKDHVLQPERIEAMRLAFQKACEALQLSGKDDALTEIVALKIIELGTGGEINPERLCSQAISSLLGQQKAS